MNAELYEKMISQLLDSKISPLIDKIKELENEIAKKRVDPEFMIDKNNHLISIKSNGQKDDCGLVVGNDGVSAEDFEASLTADNNLAIRFGKKSVEVELGLPRYVGFFEKGTTAQKGQIYTHNGSAWIAKAVTTDEPSYNSDAWHLFTRKGDNAWPCS